MFEKKAKFTIFEPNEMPKKGAKKTPDWQKYFIQKGAGGGKGTLLGFMKHKTQGSTKRHFLNKDLIKQTFGIPKSYWEGLGHIFTGYSELEKEMIEGLFAKAKEVIYEVPGVNTSEFDVAGNMQKTQVSFKSNQDYKDFKKRMREEFLELRRIALGGDVPDLDS